MRIAITRTLALQLAAVTLLLAAPALAQDDADLFGTAGIPPNVLLAFDNSGSMQSHIEPPFYDPSETTCSATSDFEVDQDTSGFVSKGTYNCIAAA